MSIRRTGGLPVDHYAVIPNEWMRDARLSWKARGLLAHLLTHSAGWETSLEQLTSAGPDGRDAVRSGLRELEEAGYLVRARARDEAGKLSGTDFELRDPRDRRVSPTSDNPTQAEPTQVHPTPKKTSSSEDHPEEDQELTLLDVPVAAGPPTQPSGLEREFADWYAAYPRKTAKPAAFKAYKGALKKTSADVLLRAVKAFPFHKDVQFVPHPATWLNNERWNDDHAPVQDAAARRRAQGGIGW